MTIESNLKRKAVRPWPSKVTLRFRDPLRRRFPAGLTKPKDLKTGIRKIKPPRDAECFAGN